MEQPAKREHSPFDSIRFKTWVYFFLMAAVILTVLWLVQIIFFKSMYQSMKTQEVERLADDIAERYPGSPGDKEFKKYIYDKAFSENLSIIVFYMDYTILDEKEGIAEITAFRADYVATQVNDELGPGIESHRVLEGWESFLVKAINNDRFSFTWGSSRGKYLVYGARLVGSNYIYISTPIVPIDSTTSVLRNQLVIVTIICLLLSVLLSWFISSHISKPISEFSKVAGKLAKGNFSVKFQGNGYNEIDDLAETLNYATEEMGKTESLRRDFLANVSHDLRTPLTMVKAYAEMIRDISGSDEQKRTQHSQVIIDEADRLSLLVNDILNLSKLQSGTEQFDMNRVDLAMLARMVTERFDIYATRDGYKFSVETRGNCMVMGDAMRLEQVLYNLIGNAINYSGDEKTVYILVRGDDDSVTVSVSDRGEGIAADEISSVWDKYYRANERKRGVVGSGLGLSIVKSVLLKHRARFGIVSKRKGCPVAAYDCSADDAAVLPSDTGNSPDDKTAVSDKCNGTNPAESANPDGASLDGDLDSGTAFWFKLPSAADED